VLSAAGDKRSSSFRPSDIMLTHQCLGIILLALIAAEAAAAPVSMLQGVNVSPALPAAAGARPLGTIKEAVGGAMEGAFDKVKAAVKQVALCKVDCLSGHAKYLYVKKMICLTECL
jgi:hypothetical protein